MGFREFFLSANPTPNVIRLNLPGKKLSKDSPKEPPQTSPGGKGGDTGQGSAAGDGQEEIKQ